MKFPLWLAAILLATMTAFPASAANTVPCTGPFVSCAIEVQAYCTRDQNGRQRMTYWDTGGNVISFERCVARIFAQHGLPNPYTPAGMAAAARGSKLQVPYTELLYPLVEP